MNLTSLFSSEFVAVRIDAGMWWGQSNVLGGRAGCVDGMPHNRPDDSSWANRHRQKLTTRHTHEDVLTDREFERLLEACAALPAPRDFQARFICLLAGRLGLRAGELAHLQTSWLDWDRRLLRIPQHEPCDCGYCRRQAAQEATHHDTLTPTQARQDRWHPKTASSARAIPFDLSLRVQLCIERFADRYDEFPHSRSTVNRRVMPPPSTPTSPTGCIRTVCGRPPPATTPTRASPPSRCRR